MRAWWSMLTSQFSGVYSRQGMAQPNDPTNKTLTHNPNTPGVGALFLTIWEVGVPRVYPLPPSGPTTIGRQPTADLQLRSSVASRQHARLRVEGGVVYLLDLGSHNGTRLNGERIAEERELQIGDIIALGDVTLVLCQQARDAVVIEDVEEQLDLKLPQGRVLSADPEMLRVYRLIKRLGRSELSVLILGETGCGKELAAATLHYYSKRCGQRYFALNCSALPPSLVESELFGHTRGAFTGSAGHRVGLLESVSGGTFFLDEIGDLEMQTQVKLLRAVQEQCILPVGANSEIKIDVRFIAATNKNLEEEVKAGRFRKDLLSRLDVAQVELPPLRRRPKDIHLLANEFLREACVREKRSPMVLPQQTMECLYAHPWSGNVRELKNAMLFLAAIVSETVVLPHHLREAIHNLSTAAHAEADDDTPPRRAARGSAAECSTHPPDGKVRPLQEVIDETEKAEIVKALDAVGWVRVRAAELLRIKLRTLYNRMTKYGLLGDHKAR